jgi:prophage regulatory protein
MQTASLPTERFLRLPEVLDATGLARSTLYERIQNGTFVKPVKLGKASRWLASEVAEWQAQAVLARGAARG